MAEDVARVSFLLELDNPSVPGVSSTIGGQARCAAKAVASGAAAS